MLRENDLNQTGIDQFFFEIYHLIISYNCLLRNYFLAYRIWHLNFRMIFFINFQLKNKLYNEKLKVIIIET